MDVKQHFFIHYILTSSQSPRENEYYLSSTRHIFRKKSHLGSRSTIIQHSRRAWFCSSINQSPIGTAHQTLLRREIMFVSLRETENTIWSDWLRITNKNTNSPHTWAYVTPIKIKNEIFFILKNKPLLYIVTRGGFSLQKIIKLIFISRIIK